MTGDVSTLFLQRLLICTSISFYFYSGSWVWCGFRSEIDSSGLFYFHTRWQEAQIYRPCSRNKWTPIVFTDFRHPCSYKKFSFSVLFLKKSIKWDLYLIFSLKGSPQRVEDNYDWLRKTMKFPVTCSLTKLSASPCCRGLEYMSQYCLFIQRVLT